MNDDLSKLFEKLNIDKNNISPDMIENLMNMINNSSTTNSSNEDSDTRKQN